jgi:hypothetical protein
MMENDAAFIQDACGLEDPERLTELSTTVNLHLCSVSEILNNIRLYFQCENWYPLYETTIYDAICYNGSTGFAWVASTQFIIVVMAMIILTLRGILYDDDVLISADSRSGGITGRKRDTSETNGDTIFPSTSDDGIEVWPEDTDDAFNPMAENESSFVSQKASF